ncbi:MAG: M28 family peptidase [Candidatus Omnitrophota bacterium]
MSTDFVKRVIKIAIRVLGVVAIGLFVGLSTTYGWQPVFTSFRANASTEAAAVRLKNTVRYLSEDVGIRNQASYDNLQSAAEYIEKRLVDLGYTVERWPYTINGQSFRNIVVRLKNNASDEYVLIRAHYDACFNPGADDNASGIAGVLELAGSLKQEPLKANIMFVAFTNEEPPFFKTSQMGSRVFVRELASKNIRIREAIVFDMIGYYSTGWFQQKYLPFLGPFYPHKGDFIAIVGDFGSRALVDRIQKSFIGQKGAPMRTIVAPRTVPGLNFSDHASFWEVNIPAVMLTDSAYLRNPHYHKDSDTWDKLNYQKMAAVVEGMRMAIIKLAN